MELRTRVIETGSSDNTGTIIGLMKDGSVVVREDKDGMCELSSNRKYSPLKTPKELRALRSKFVKNEVGAVGEDIVFECKAIGRAVKRSFTYVGRSIIDAKFYIGRNYANYKHNMALYKGTHLS